MAKLALLADAVNCAVTDYIQYVEVALRHEIELVCKWSEEVPVKKK
jgi:hypothetical protein